MPPTFGAKMIAASKNNRAAPEKATINAVNMLARCITTLRRGRGRNSRLRGVVDSRRRHHRRLRPTLLRSGDLAGLPFMVDARWSCAIFALRPLQAKNYGRSFPLPTVRPAKIRCSWFRFLVDPAGDSNARFFMSHDATDATGDRSSAAWPPRARFRAPASVPDPRQCGESAPCITDGHFERCAAIFTTSGVKR